MYFLEIYIVNIVHCIYALGYLYQSEMITCSKDRYNLSLLLDLSLKMAITNDVSLDNWTNYIKQLQITYVNGAFIWLIVWTCMSWHNQQPVCVRMWIIFWCYKHLKFDPCLCQ